MNSNNSTSSLEQANSSLQIIGMVDHSILDRESSLVLVEARSMTANNRPSSDEEDTSQDNGNHSTFSTPDKLATSVKENIVGAS